MTPSAEVHVVPLDDLREHAIARTCWCHPFDEDGICVHDALDGRVAYERGRKMS